MVDCEESGQGQRAQRAKGSRHASKGGLGEACSGESPSELVMELSCHPSVGHSSCLCMQAFRVTVVQWNKVRAIKKDGSRGPAEESNTAQGGAKRAEESLNELKTH